MASGDSALRSGAEKALASVLLPSLVHEGNAAVLMVDLERGDVVYANDLAIALAPAVSLPMSIDAWSAAAVLRDVTGRTLPGGGTAVGDDEHGESLLRIARGTPVTGEAVTAARQTEATGAREVMWVLGLPLEGAPEPLSSLALVVFVPARNARLIAEVQESAATLRDRAVLATRVSFTITDVRADDGPLVWVNPAFTATTGYEFDEAVGRNCRFLQGPDTDPAAVEEIRAALRVGQSFTTTLLNYRRDGTQFWNELSISPVRDNDGSLTHFVGVQADVTRRVEAQITRDDALAQVARSADRLLLLADFTSQMAMSQQPEQILDLLADVLIPRVGTFCVICTYDELGRLAPPLIRHERGADPDIAAKVEALRNVVPEQVQGTSPIWRVLRGDVREVLIDDYDASPPGLTGSAADDRTSLLHQLGLHSMVVVPLLARSGILGALTLISDADRQPLDTAGLSLLRDLAVRAGLMLENTQLYERERNAAATLQRSMLPRVPSLPGLDVATAYVPAADEAAVGGDWYDVFALRPPGGVAEGAVASRVGVVVGDVMGHDISSAARMGKLSTIVRSYAWPGSEPGVVLDATDELLAGTGLDFLATCLYAQLIPHADGATLHYVSAGHPPALVRLPDGSTAALTEGRRPMLGVSRLLGRAPQQVTHATIELPHGATFICFTDGLVEAAAAEPDIDLGLAALIDLSNGLPVDASPAAIVSGLVGDERHPDDVAIVAIRVS